MSDSADIMLLTSITMLTGGTHDAWQCPACKCQQQCSHCLIACARSTSSTLFTTTSALEHAAVCPMPDVPASAAFKAPPHIDVSLQVPTTVSPVPEMPASAASQGPTTPNTRLVDNLARFPAVKPRSLDWLLKLVEALYKNKATKVRGGWHSGSSSS